MILKKEFYAVQCDNCLEINKGDDSGFWESKESAENIAIDSDWFVQNEMYYCQDCHTWDDDCNLVIDGYRQKSSIAINQEK